MTYVPNTSIRREKNNGEVVDDGSARLHDGKRRGCTVMDDGSARLHDAKPAEWR
ncbi:pentachlorophenol monooxygenase [Sesbania bispinosa]|nr:pentachlorophenol monooxygenase [Sesbania bispinosa]